MSRITILPLVVYPFLLLVSTNVQAINVHYCDENTDYDVKVKEVDLWPYPIARGEPATFSIYANTGRAISSGKLVIEVSYFGWHIHSGTHDLCNETTCPVETGDFLVSHSQLLPGYTPPGPYSLQMKMLDSRNKELTCIKFSLDIGSQPSLGNI